MVSLLDNVMLGNMTGGLKGKLEAIYKKLDDFHWQTSM